MNIENVEAIRKLVVAEIAANPLELDGFQWCALPQPIIAATLGCSVSTVRRIISEKPFVRDWALIGDAKVKTLLLREGDPNAMTPRRIAKALRNIWIEATGKAITPKDFGLLVGLAKDWPDGFQFELLKFVLADWQRFMSAVKWWIDMENIAADVEGKPPTLYKRYYRYPAINVVRTFWEPAIEAYETHLQGEDPAKFVAFAKAVALKTATG